MALIFSDSFTEDTSVELTLHTPDTGTGWTKVITVGGGSIVAVAFSGRATASGTLSQGVLYTADTTYSSADYEVTVAMTVGDSGDDKSHLVARYQDTNNFYGVQFNTEDGTAFDNDGNFLYKCSGGTFSQLGSNIGAITNGQTVKLKVSGSTISVEVDGVEQTSATDSTHTSAGKAGLGMGNVLSNGADLSIQALDTFQVNTISSSTAVQDIIMSGVIPFPR